MLKILMLFLTFTLLTCSAALMGLSDDALSVFIKKDHVPYEEIFSGEEERQEESREEISQEPPRFIKDEPLEENMLMEDPSAAPKKEEGEGDFSVPTVPDEREIKKTARPYIEEIISIKDNAFGNLSTLEKKVAVDYLSCPKEKRDEMPKILYEKYMPRARLIVETCDRDVERALKKLEAALKAINAPMDIKDEALKTYEQEKEEKKEYYKGLLSSFLEEEGIEIS